MAPSKLLFLYVLAGLLLLSKSQDEFLPNLPAGEFRIVFQTLSPCESTKNHQIQYNLYYSKRSSNVTEIKGNITAKIYFDDSGTIDVNIASWSLTGGWKENAVVYKTNNGCSNTKKLVGPIWSSAIKAFNIPFENCPIPPGTYISSGLDTSGFQEANFPKIFFYGKYKFVFKLKGKDGKLLGCLASQLKLVRPWEVPKI